MARGRGSRVWQYTGHPEVWQHTQHLHVCDVWLWCPDTVTSPPTLLLQPQQRGAAEMGAQP